MKLTILNKATIENSIPVFISRNLNTFIPMSMCIQGNSKHTSMEAYIVKICMQRNTGWRNFDVRVGF